MTRPLSFDETINLLQKLRPYYSPAEAVFWMSQPHPQLDGRKPTECHWHEVQAVIDRLDSDAYL